MNDKANDAFKTISEVSALLDVPQHVLRFWESKFSSLRPLKRSGGRRYYRPDDVAVLRRIRQLLYVDGFTIKGAQKLVRSKASAAKPNASVTASSASDKDLAAAMAMLDDVKTRLAALKQQLNH
ncbi:MerR family transcriptional regulator [Alphaproteobacteria bacterium]|nr:MerR family transcriptional regulator [Alphaproteobacteria bacterium]